MKVSFAFCTAASLLSFSSAFALPLKPKALTSRPPQLQGTSDATLSSSSGGAATSSASISVRRDPAFGTLRKTPIEKLLLRGGANEALTLFQKYDNQMKKRPIITKMWSCFFIGAFGDMLSQLLLSKGGSISGFKMVTYGLSQVIYFAPVIHYWFQAVEDFGNLPVFSNGPNFIKVLSMTIFDQTIGATLVLSGFFTFFTCWSALIGGTFLSTGLPALLAQGFAKVRADLPATLVANWKLWPVANFINFRFVPLNYRVIFTNIVAIFWNIYLSAMVSS